MRTAANLFDYQKRAVNHQCVHPESMLWLDVGLGKTVITLTSIVHLIATGYLRAVIVVAPVRVCKMVWRQEAMKWEHTKQIVFSMLTGDRDQRTRALMQPAHVYLINYENLRWLAETLQHYYISKGRELPFNGIVWDEVSKMKNSATHRVRAIKNMLSHMPWRTGLTGTPASNGYKDLHGQYLVVDQGQRLGVQKTEFLTRWYKKGDGESRTLIPYRDTEEGIKALISDITLEMSAEEYNPLPDLIVNDIKIDLPDDLRERYDTLEKEFFLILDSGKAVEAFNQAALTNKCLQFANGSIYPISGLPLWESVHQLKLDAMEEVIEESNGEPILCSYAFRSDAERIMNRFKHLDPVNLTECKSERQLQNAMDRWKAGTLPLCVAHPGSTGHGLDGLQERGHITLWFGLNWSLELVDQFNGRLRRQGQGKPVISHRLLVTDTLDMVQADRLAAKSQTEKSLRKAVNDYRQRRGM